MSSQKNFALKPLLKSAQSVTSRSQAPSGTGPSSARPDQSVTTNGAPVDSEAAAAMDNGLRCSLTIPLVESYPPIKERGFYSDIVSQEAALQKPDLFVGPDSVDDDMLWKVATKDHTPSVTTFESPNADNFLNELTQGRIGKTTKIHKSSDFPEAAYEPKVQRAFIVQPGELPRKVEIERRKRSYSRVDFLRLLEVAAIRTELLMPRKPTPSASPPPPSQDGQSAKISAQQAEAKPAYLPLYLFDNKDLTCRTPEEWLSLGLVNYPDPPSASGSEIEPPARSGSGVGAPDAAVSASATSGEGLNRVVRKPVPGRALLPVRDDLHDLDPRDTTVLYDWFDVGVLDYSSEADLYLVVKVDRNGRVCDQSGRTVLNGGFGLTVTDLDETPAAQPISDSVSTTSSSSKKVATPSLLQRFLTPSMYWVPPIRVLFAAEDPALFAQRLIEAYREREHTEALIRYELYVDCMPMDGVGELDQAAMRRIVYWARGSGSPALAKNKLVDDYIQVLEKEVNIDFCRSMNRIVFERTVEQDPVTFSFVTLPDKQVWGAGSGTGLPARPGPRHVGPGAPVTPPPPSQELRGCVGLPPFPYDTRFDAFAFSTVLTLRETIEALCKLRAECNKVCSMSLLNTQLSKSMRLEEFEQTQAQASSQVSLYLRDSWISTLKNAIRTSLRDVDKGWFSLEERNWEIYQNSKLKKFMEQVKFIMQDTLRYLVQDSLSSFTQMVLDASISVMKVDDDLLWQGDLLLSKYKPKRNAIFLVDLQLDAAGSHYSTPLPSYEVSLSNLFNKAIQCTQSVPQLEKFILENIFWSGTPLLESVGEHEPQVEDWRNAMGAAIKKSLIPLAAYAKRYEKYVDLANMDLNAYVRVYEQQFYAPAGGAAKEKEKDKDEDKPAAPGRTPQDIKTDIEALLAEKDVLESIVPSSIIIGPFLINTEGVRQALSKKKKAQASTLQDFLAKVLRKNAEEVCEEFRSISRKLFEKPNSIEELAELREWIKGVPGKLEEQEDAIEKVVKEYDLLDDFWYNLSQEDFNLKWSTLGWPHKILLQIEQVEKQHLEDEDRFRKLQTTDQASLNDRVDALTMAVSGLSGYTDVNKCHDIAADVRKLNKNIKECQQLAQTYNQRERLFALPITNYDRLAKLAKDFEPFRNLWTGVSDWKKWYEAWMNEPLQGIDAENLEKNVTETFKTMHKSAKLLSDLPQVSDVATGVKNEIDNFRPHIPLIQALRNPGMRARHWEQMSNELGIKVVLKATLTFSKCLEMGLANFVPIISKIAEVAGKEFAIEQALLKMESEWEPISFEVLPYKETGTYIIKASDEITQMIDDHIVMTQSMSFSPYKKAFEERISSWENKLRIIQDVLDEWLKCQRTWLYLEPIFSSEDINRQLPTESKRYQTMERTWRKIMKNARENPKVISLCPEPRLLEQLKECNRLLDQVQKGLSEYLETKRAAFPRFYFLSDDELLEILSQTRDPTAVQPHLRKCFENIAKLQFEPDTKITAMFSGEGERIDFRQSFYPTGNVEEWMNVIENSMRSSLRAVIDDALKDYPKSTDANPHPARSKWVLKWPAQVVLAGSTAFWTIEVGQALERKQVPEQYQHQLKQLDELREMIRGPLSKAGRMCLSALIVIEVHARDVVAKLIEEKVQRPEDFEWISQLRYYWHDENLYVRAVNAEFEYGYEYLGNTTRLVITPLTDRCYLTLTGALFLKFGGAPAGPAGTGKTESVKDLSKAMAIQCVVFNCSDQLDFMAMGKFFKGLASSGAWACFDEFNRIDIEVLSVVAMQITTIQKAQQQRVDRFLFEGVEISLKFTCSVFITMNPGYAGRTELPDNLKALFRPVAMMVPDYGLIAEISLFSFGFSEARALAKKIVSTFKLSSEQLSSQDHYDFGMRAVKSVISAAGNLKRQYPDMNEEQIVYRAIKDVNVPKFLLEDLKLFNGIVSDLFPTIKQEAIDYGSLLTRLHEITIRDGMKDVEGFIHKCIQLFETTIVRHGLMLVGPTGSGKTKCYDILRKSMTELKGQMSPAGMPFETVKAYILNPKSITMGQLYGEFDLLTHEWTDGILSSLIRDGVNATDNDKRWYILDGPVDALWIENMNSVLDDNKKLCLSSGEIIKLTDNMTMMFEVQDLAVASPATVSRCGMVYLEPGILGLTPFVECWIRKLPGAVYPHKAVLEQLFSSYLVDSLAYMRKNLVEIVPTTDCQMTMSLLKVLDAFLKPLQPEESMGVMERGGKRKVEEVQVPETTASRLPELLEAWFYFALVWSVGASCDHHSRKKFDAWLREKMTSNEAKFAFPVEGLCYDYRLEDAGLMRFGKDAQEDDDDEGKKVEKNIGWVHWLANSPSYSVPNDAKFSDIIVPTIDTVRYAHLIEMLLVARKCVLCVGPTGTAKTIIVTDKLTKNMPKDFIPELMAFSAKTSANQTQDLIDSKLDKRRKGVFGPPLGKVIVFFIDDLNMPAFDQFGSQAPVELIRQWMDFKGWYDRKAVGEFKTLVDVGMLCAMGPPGGGRNPITQRLQRHFNMLAFTELEDASLGRIFETILSSWLNRATNANFSAATVCSPLVQACVAVYNRVQQEMLPTPTRSHYTFNLRDLSKVFQGLLMLDPGRIDNIESLLRLWYHESCRVFQDRLINDEDRQLFAGMLDAQMGEKFQRSLALITPPSKQPSNLSQGQGQDPSAQPLLYGDFLVPNVENKQYTELSSLEPGRLQKVVEDYMDDFLQINPTATRLVIFSDALVHICRICRIIRQPLGNALLLGLGGSGRRSLTRLAAHMEEYESFQIELTKNYSMTDWKNDLKKVMMRAGIESRQTVFLFSDTQLKFESFLEDLNNILNSGDVPNIYQPDELENIFKSMKPIVQEAGQTPSKTNMFTTYTKRVRNALHLVLTMSPIGEQFRARLRQFPALVNCCTIDWFSAWPDDALRGVALRFLSDLDGLSDALQGFVVQMCQHMHQSVVAATERFRAQIGRHNYVTPTSYLELMQIFSKLHESKRQEVAASRNRTKTGLDKLLYSAQEVAKLQEELETMKPLLETAVKEAAETMIKIQEDTKAAEETRTVVAKQEAEASEKARICENITSDAQRVLDEALPALDAALASLKSLNKNDVVEVRAMMRPPEGVRMVIEAVCIMKNVKPKMVAGDKPGSKVADYMDPGRGLLQDPGQFLNSLFTYDKDNIPDSVIEKIQPFIDNEAFQPASIAKVSKACTSICLWVRAMYKYHFVSKDVAPKREALRSAQEELAVVQRVLDDARRRLFEVEQGIAALQAKYEECIQKKEELEHKSAECSARLVRAGKLINGLADEKGRWEESIERLGSLMTNFVGDVLVSSGFVAYLGPFTMEFRKSLATDWRSKLIDFKIPHSEDCDLISTLGNPVKIRNWQIDGLPKDNLSIENAVITQFSRRWSLFIDPQGQANKWVKNMEKNNAIDVFKLSDRDFVRTLENAIRFGKPCLLENLGEELDPILESILMKQTFKQAGSLCIRLGDAVIPYHEDFRFYMTSKLPNPHYTPEVSIKVTLTNFMLSPSGLQEQLLGLVVAEERPDLEEAKNQLIVQGAKMKQELKDLEDKILERLSASQGNPVDDIDLIENLELSKVKSVEIKSKMVVAEQTERDIDETRSKYIPVAVQAQILFFCVADLINIDPMYQYSLEWFISIFVSSITNADRSENLKKRIQNINSYFTFSLYSNVCRSLFEKHKLMFAALITSRFLIDEARLNPSELRFLLAGASGEIKQEAKPADWLPERCWKEILELASLPKFGSFLHDFSELYLDDFKRFFDSPEPHRMQLPGDWEEALDDIGHMLVLKAIRPDKLVIAMQEFVSKHLGERFVEPQTTELALVFKESSPTSPLVFVLSQGTDPAADLYKFAEEMRFSKKLTAISLGQGQGPIAESMMRSAMERGKWVFFQNCHLSPSWMPSLERLVEQIDPEKVHRDFRLWLTSMPTAKFPVFILQNSAKMTIEPPRGVKANLLKAFGQINDEYLNSCGTKNSYFRNLLFSLSLFHGVTLERRKFGPLGFNIPYEFTDGDLRICMSQLRMFLLEYEETPFKVLRYTAGEINYGGRVTDDWDRRCLRTILLDLYGPNVLEKDHIFSPSGVYKQIAPENDHAGYLGYIRSLPINDPPEIFGLHDNASITLAQNEANLLLGNLLALQPKSGAAAGGGSAGKKQATREELVEEMARSILSNVRDPFPLDDVSTKYPVLYEQSMNTVLVQEVIRYNRLLSAIKRSLSDLLKAIKGLVVLSQELEAMLNSLFDNRVPVLWASKAYPSLKPLSAWVADLRKRLDFISGWIDYGAPAVYWISGFFFPQAFLTGTLQNYARARLVSIDTVSFGFRVRSETREQLEASCDPARGGQPLGAAEGCYIDGLFLEGARWDPAPPSGDPRLNESEPKQLYTEMPPILLVPSANRQLPSELGQLVYDCPVYKTLTRAGTLSTTGHSTNFVFAIELPTNEEPSHWVKRGVAMLCALNY